MLFSFFALEKESTFNKNLEIFWQIGNYSTEPKIFTAIIPPCNILRLKLPLLRTKYRQELLEVQNYRKSQCAER